MPTKSSTVGDHPSMARTEAQPASSMIVREDQPLIGVPVEENGHVAVRYFADEAEADKALTDDGIQAALSLAGAWSDLDWDEAIEALDRIRHESKPTPPIDDL